MYLTTWTSPTTLYDLDGDKDTFAKSIFNTDVSYPGFDTLVTEEVEVPGHDGTLIPLSIIHKKGIPLDGTSSCILEGYGAYGISYTPALQRAALDRLARSRAGLRASAGRKRERRGLVQGGLQDDQAEYLEGLHFLRRVPREEGLHEPRASRGHRHERRAES